MVFGKKYYKGANGTIRQTGSTDFWVEYKDIKNYKDKYIRSIK